VRTNFPLGINKVYIYLSFCVCVKSSLWSTLAPHVLTHFAQTFTPRERSHSKWPMSYQSEGLWGSFGNHFPWVFWILFWAKVPLSSKKMWTLGTERWRLVSERRERQMMGRREKRWLREDGWLQESEATGGQDVPLLEEACWRTGHDAHSVCVCVWVCVAVNQNTSVGPGEELRWGSRFSTILSLRHEHQNQATLQRRSSVLRDTRHSAGLMKSSLCQSSSGSELQKSEKGRRRWRKRGFILESRLSSGSRLNKTATVMKTNPSLLRPLDSSPPLFVIGERGLVFALLGGTSSCRSTWGASPTLGVCRVGDAVTPGDPDPLSISRGRLLGEAVMMPTLNPSPSSQTPPPHTHTHTLRGGLMIANKER